MNSAVSGHAAAAREALTANVALVGLVVHVHGAQMNHERVAPWEGLGINTLFQCRC